MWTFLKRNSSFVRLMCCVSKIGICDPVHDLLSLSLDLVVVSIDRHLYVYSTDYLSPVLWW